jgi:5-formyltetrahydrofolate cyclo-ligase
MIGELNQLKQTLRGDVRKRVAALSVEERRRASAALCERLRQHEIWQGTRPVLFFSPLADEPDVWPLVSEALATGRTVALPRFDSQSGNYVVGQISDVQRDLNDGNFKIREPKVSCPMLKMSEFELIIVPGVAFDPSGNRLGRGRGFYDRLLADAQSGTLCGVAFEEQIVAAVPAAAHDVKMDFVATANGVMRGKPKFQNPNSK